MGRSTLVVVVAAAAAGLAGSAGPAGCGGQVATPNDTGLGGLMVTAVAPATLLPGSTLVVSGRSFVDEPWGDSRVRLRGTMGGAAVDLARPARFVDYGELQVDWQGGLASGLPADQGTFTGDVILEVRSTVDGELYASAPLPVTLELRTQLSPTVTTLQTGVIYVNDPIVVEGDGFLLGGGEGQSVAIVEGCFTREGTATCVPLPAREVPLLPESRFSRTHAAFAFVPGIAGIQPGEFTGTVTIANRHGPGGTGVATSTPAGAASYLMVPPQIFRISPSTASLGQFVRIEGGGFVGLAADAPDQTQLVTLVELSGTFTPNGGSAVPVTLELVPEFVFGRLVRYVITEDDELGQRIDVRHAQGTFAGTVRPIIKSGGETVTGDATPVTLGLAPVKQVVWLNFQPGYVESLRHFGLRGADMLVRQRVLAVAARDYEGVNIEFRATRPDDFAYFAQVDLAGPDPNALGLLGYDNSPGKDTGNVRLYDKIGGVNAQTQEDGYPGYGGVFVESFFGFSEHPGALAAPLEGGQDPLFDAIFDPFRPDRGGRPVSAADLAAMPTITDGSDCPAAKDDRPRQVACAVFVLGNLIGTTMTHEVGHSLGLANPEEPMSFHNIGDEPNRLMDAGGARTFTERAELLGDGPARFCDAEYAYLRQILPSFAPASPVDRPSCF